MEFRLSQEQQEAIAQVRAFGKTYLVPNSVKKWRKEQGLPDEVVQAFVNLGFNPSALITEKLTEKSSILTLALVVEELASISGAMLPFQTDMLNLCCLKEFASPEILQKMRKEYEKTGRVAHAFAITEPQAGSDSQAMKTVVRTVDDKLLLNGEKIFVNNGEYAPNILVAAIDGDSENDGKYPAISLWLIPNNLKGIKTYPIEKTAQRMIPFSEVSFDNVEVSPQHFLAGGKNGMKKLFKIFNYGRVIICASTLGMAQAAMNDAIMQAGQRNAFGVSISSFQLIQQMIVDMEVKIRTMRSLLYQAAWALGNNAESATLDVALMKRYIPKTAVEVASDAIQIFGGLGYTENTRVFSIWEDCRGNQIAEGTDEIMVHIAASPLMKNYQEILS